MGMRTPSNITPRRYQPFHLKLYGQLRGTEIILTFRGDRAVLRYAPGRRNGSPVRFD